MWGGTVKSDVNLIYCEILVANWYGCWEKGLQSVQNSSRMPF